MRWAWRLKPLLRVLVRRFLQQGRTVVAMQQQGLRHGSNLMPVRDADSQIRWYNQLKNESAQFPGEGREFMNPVGSTTLRWRSQKLVWVISLICSPQPGHCESMPVPTLAFAPGQAQSTRAIPKAPS
jgi:hypothetical protein